MRSRTPALAAALAFALAPLGVAAPAEAAVPFQIVTVRLKFAPAEVTVTRGDTLWLTNFDIERHDVTALDIGLDGKPLFASATIGAAKQAAVAGVETLEPSVYPFYCTVHAEMVGNLTVLETPVP